jgi:hypothetical protein
MRREVVADELDRPVVDRRPAALGPNRQCTQHIGDCDGDLHAREVSQRLIEVLEQRGNDAGRRRRRLHRKEDVELTPRPDAAIFTPDGWIVSDNDVSASTARRAVAPALPLAAQLLVAAAVLTVLGVMVAGVIPVGLWTLIVAVALVASMFLSELGLEQLRNGRIALSVLVAVSFAVGMSLFYYLACRYLANRWSLEGLPFVVLLVALALAFAVALQIPKLRLWLLDNTGLVGPFGAIALLFAVLTSVFAAITVIAAKEELVSFTGGNPGSPSFEESARLYVWHFSNAVPLLDVNETLRWKAPLVYTSSRAGILVLLYKFAVIVPLIGAFFFYWKEQNN